MSDQALILHDATRRHFEISTAAESLKAAALELAGLIMRVSSPKQNDTAVEAQKALTELISLSEKTRQAAKEPILTEGRLLDKTVEQFVAELQTERSRIARLCGDYQAVLAQQRRAAELLERGRLEQIERDRQAELLKAQTIEQIAAVQEKHDEIAKQASESAPVPEPVRAKGQVVRTDWEVEVTDIHAVYRAAPFCVKLEPKHGEIKQYLEANNGKLAGVRAMKVTRSDVRPGKAMVVEV